EGLIYGLMMIQEKIRGESLGRHSEHRREDPDRAGVPNATEAEIQALSGPFGNSTQQNWTPGGVTASWAISQQGSAGEAPSQSDPVSDAPPPSGDNP
ncbi:MAG: hypothetical protein WD056_00115, partial [Gemmatimonadota bacterium]